MKYKTLLLLPILCWSLLSFAQDKRYVYYYDANMNICQQANAIFTGYGTFENNLYKLLIFYNKTQKPIFIQYYTDSTLTKAQGSYETYYENGIKKEQGYYEADKINGEWERYDSTGQMTDSINYKMGVVTDSSYFHYNKNGMVNGHRLTDVKNNTMHETDYNDSGKLSTEIIFTGNKGIQKNYNASGVKTDSLFTREEIDAEFPGGADAWTKYITKAIEENIDDIQKHRNSSGTCIVRFIVDREGNISDVEATTMKNTTLAKVCMAAIRTGPKWIPAHQFGRPVNAYRLQPVTFTFQN